METWLPSHDRYMMTMADAVQGFIKNILGIDSEEMVMWGHTVIRAEKFDWKKHAKILPDQKPVEFRLWQSCWSQMALMDIHHYPLWEQGVHDCLQKHFGVLQRIFSKYTKGISGIDSAVRIGTRLGHSAPPHTRAQPHIPLTPRAPSLHSRRTRWRWNSRSSTTSSRTRRYSDGTRASDTHTAPRAHTQLLDPLT